MCHFREYDDLLEWHCIKKEFAMNIYVGNMSYNVSEAQLRETFEEYGEVDSVNIITDRDSGRTKGFGFVEMKNDEQARAAIENLNGIELDGRNLTVNEARPRNPRPSGGSRW
jgi:cold-inducible RNA-binding protein